MTRKLRKVANDERSTLLINSVLALVALASLVIAILSYQISQRSIDIDEETYASKRTVFLSAQISEDKDYFLLQPNSEDILILQVLFFSPNIIGNDWVGFRRPTGIPIHGPSFKGYLELPRQFVERELTDEFQQVRGNERASFFYTGRVPVILHTTYAAQGERLAESSLYDLWYSGLGPTSEGAVRVMFTDLTFHRRIESFDSPENQSFINWLFESEFEVKGYAVNGSLQGTRTEVTQ